ncbi:hypothetical protein U9M48_021171, partial [Paspalum notatum var. saurae]
MQVVWMSVIHQADTGNHTTRLTRARLERAGNHTRALAAACSLLRRRRRSPCRLPPPAGPRASRRPSAAKLASRCDSIPPIPTFRPCCAAPRRERAVAACLPPPHWSRIWVIGPASSIVAEPSDL